MVRKMSLLLLAILCVAPSALAGAAFGPQAGYYKADGADEGEFLYGGALRLKLAPFLGAEGAVNYRQESYRDGAVTVKSWPIMASALLYPMPMLYGIAGGGWYNTTIEYDAGLLNGTSMEETSNEFGWHFGGGVELPLGESAKIAGDIRYVFIDYEFEEFPGSEDTNSDFYVITVTLLLGSY